MYYIVYSVVVFLISFVDLGDNLILVAAAHMHKTHKGHQRRNCSNRCCS